MDFGNKISTIGRGAVVITIFTAIVSILVFIFGPPIRPGTEWAFFALFLLGPGVFLAACFPTLAVSVRITEGRVKHLLFGRFILSDHPVEDFVSLDTKGVAPWAAVLRFSRNRRIRFAGAHLGVLRELEETLEKEKKAIQQPQQQRP